MGIEEVVEGHYHFLTSSNEVSEKINDSVKNRLVWYVAIASFVILKGRQLWDALGLVEFNGVTLFCLILPWVLVALSAVITHFIIDEAWVKSNQFFLNKRAALDLCLESVEEGDENLIEIRSIFNNTFSDLKELKKLNDKWGNIAQWSERITFALLLLGFIWSLIGPFLLAIHQAN